MFVIIILELAFGCLAAVYFGDFENAIRNEMIDTMNLIRDSDDSEWVKQSWDAMQEEVDGIASCLKIFDGFLFLVIMLRSWRTT